MVSLVQSCPDLSSPVQLRRCLCNIRLVISSDQFLKPISILLPTQSYFHTSKDFFLDAQPEFDPPLELVKIGLSLDVFIISTSSAGLWGYIWLKLDAGHVCTNLMSIPKSTK